MTASIMMVEQRARRREAGDIDDGARGKIIADDLFAGRDDALRVADVLEEHRHVHDIGKLCAGVSQRSAEGKKDLPNLSFEVVDLLSGVVNGASLVLKPDRLARCRDHGLGVRVLLGVGILDELLAGGLGLGSRGRREQRGKCGKATTRYEKSRGDQLSFW